MYSITPKSLPLDIPADVIGLPTNGATILNLTLLHAGDPEAPGTIASFMGLPVRIDHYKAEGIIHPVDSTAPDIRFEIGFPLEWNGKLLQQGGGGINGLVPSSGTVFPGQGFMDEPPLTQGYIVFGSDSGHALDPAKPWDCSWAMNRESLENFAHMSLKKTRDVAYYLSELFYGAKPEKVYFYGGSNGGRECMKAIQNYPLDYDGAICFFPVLFWILKVLADARNADVIEDIGESGQIDKETYARIKKTITEMCDGLDGAIDSVISDLKSSASKRCEIEMAIAEFLTPEQMRALQSFAAPMSLSFPLAFGEVSLPGYPVFEGVNLSEQFSSTSSARDAGQVDGADNIISYFIARDPDFDPRHLIFENWKERIIEISELMDAYDTNLDDFHNHGGKLILVQGMADPLVTVYGTNQYYEMLLSKYGKDKLSTFLRYYTAPGYGHGFGDTFTITANILGELEKWVENGIAPEELIVADFNPETAGRTRPMYQYPCYPRYDGKGDINVASSFFAANGSNN